MAQVSTNSEIDENRMLAPASFGRCFVGTISAPRNNLRASHKTIGKNAANGAKQPINLAPGRQ
jgi:hypothetical protein